MPDLDVGSKVRGFCEMHRTEIFIYKPPTEKFLLTKLMM